MAENRGNDVIRLAGCLVEFGAKSSTKDMDGIRRDRIFEETKLSYCSIKNFDKS